MIREHDAGRGDFARDVVCRLSSSDLRTVQ
jgi:hypothetical protein